MSRYFDLCCWPSTPSNILRLRIGSQCNATSNLRNKWKYDIVKNDSEILDISSIWWRSNHSGPRGSKIFENYLHCLNHPYTQPQTKASSNLMKQIKSILRVGEASWYHWYSLHLRKQTVQRAGPDQYSRASQFLRLLPTLLDQFYYSHE